MTRQWSRWPGASPRLRAATIVLGITLWLGAGPMVAAQAPYEPPPILRASAILPSDLVSGPHHRVEERVVNDGYMNTYTIQSRFGRFTASSTAGLRVRVHEIDALAKMETVERSKEYAESVKKAGGDVVEGVKSLATQPVETVSGAVTGVGRMFQRAGESLFGSTRSEAEESRWKDLIGFAKTKREYAQLFGVDVYSSNEVLQNRLNEIAWAGYAGGLTTSAVLSLVPGAAGFAISVSGGTRLLNEVIATTPPTDLRRRNRDALNAMGIHPDVTELFIDNAVFSPREQTLLVAALEEMTGTADRAVYVKFAVPTDRPELAFFRQRMAEMYAGYHRNRAPIAQFVAVGQLVAARNRAGAVVLAPPLDHLVWTEPVARIVRAFDRRASELGAARKELWVAGTVSPRAGAELRRQGWTVHEQSEARLLARP